MTSGLDSLDRAESLDALGDIATTEAIADTVRAQRRSRPPRYSAGVSALVAAVSADNLDRGMFLASMSGQWVIAANVVELMRMPVLAAFLDAKGRQLRGLAVNEIGRAMAAAALAEGMEALSDRLAAIGLSEIAEGISEIEAADALLDARDEAVASGIETAAAGVAELSAAEAGGASDSPGWPAPGWSWPPRVPRRSAWPRASRPARQARSRRPNPLRSVPRRVRRRRRPRHRPSQRQRAKRSSGGTTRKK